MAYTISWHTPNQVLLLTLSGEYTLEEAKEVNKLIMAELDRSDKGLSILINAMHMARPHNFSDIRSVQKYMDHRNLKYIYIASGDRLVKLAMMVIFNLSRAFLHMSDTLEQATFLAQRRSTAQ